MGEQGAFEAESLDAARLEADWGHALDVAADAVSSGVRSKSLGATEAAAVTEHIRADRQWLAGFSPVFHKLFPAQQPPPPAAT